MIESHVTDGGQLPQHYDCRYLAILPGCRSARLAGPSRGATVASPAASLIVSIFISRPQPPQLLTAPLGRARVKADQNLISENHIISNFT